MKRFLCAIGVVGVLFSSCSKDVATAPKSDNELKITSGIATRASGIAWDDNDQIGVFASQGSTILGTNTPFSTELGGATANFTNDGDPIYFPMVGVMDVVAYYPYEASTTLTAYAVDVATQTDPTVIDLMSAKRSAETQSTPLSMHFYHRLSQLSLTIVAGDGLSVADLAGTKVTISGLVSDATYNLTTDAITLGSTSTELAFNVNSDVTFATAIAVPQTVGSSVRLTFDIPAIGELFTSINVAELLSGKNHKFTATINNNRLDLSGSIIEDWGDSSASGDDDLNPVLPPVAPDPDVTKWIHDDTNFPDVANCYIVSPSTTEEIVIPVNEYISYFWKSYGADATEKSYATLTAYDLEAVVIWHDAATNPIDLTTLKVDAVTIPGTTTKASPMATYPDFTASTSVSVMKFKLAAEAVAGNCTIGVREIGKTDFLWSWHIWLTDYNPYTSFVTLNGMNIMDRNLGAKGVEYADPSVSGSGVLHYQWGRKDPLPHHQTPVLSTVAVIADAVKAPGGFYIGSNASHYDWCGVANRWDQDKGHTWRDKMLNDAHNDMYDNRKSIFDPSPLGWKIGGSTTAETHTSVFDFLSTYNFVWSSVTKGRTSRVNSLFYLPAAGRRTSGGDSPVVGGRDGYYWATSYHSGTFTHCLLISSSSMDTFVNGHYRAGALSVRSIQD